MVIDPSSAGAATGIVGALIVAALVFPFWPAIVYPLPTLAWVTFLGAWSLGSVRRRRYGWRAFGWLAFGLDLLLIGAVLLLALLVGAIILQISREGIAVFEG